MKQLVQHERSGKIAVCDVPAPTCADGRILVRNRASLVSLGTERSQALAGRQGIAGKARERPDLVRRFVEKARRDGVGETIRRAASKLDAVRQLGYSSAGVVTRVGAGVTTVSPGDRIACFGVGWATHAESVLLPPTLCSRLPAGVSFEAGSFGMLGGIALNGIRKAQATFGETVVVVGLGLLGLLTAQLLRAYGMRVLGYDIDPRKCELAAGLGIDGRSGDWDAFAGEVAAGTAGHGADAVMLTVAAADAGPVDRGVRLLRPAGRAVVVGMADVHPDRQAMWAREAELVVPRAAGPGSYEPGYEQHAIDHPFGQVRWTQQRNVEEFLRQIAAGRVQVGPLVTHRRGIEDAAEWYARLVDDRDALTVGAVIEYPGDPDDAGVQESTLAVAPPRSARASAADAGAAPAVAVCGAGAFAREHLLPALARVPGLRLRTLVTARGGTSAHVARKYGFEQHSTDFTAALADPETDAVVVATPNRLHASMARAALDAGKHVFVEKPLCVDESQLADLQDALEGAQRAAADRRPCLMVGYNRRFSRHAQWARDALGSRTAPLVAHYRVCPGYLPPDHPVNDPVEGGGRVIADACQFVDLLMFLTGSLPVRVHASRIRADGPAAANDNFVATLTFADGSVGAITYAAAGDGGYAGEWFEVFAEGKTVAVRDYRESVLHAAGRRRKFRTRGQDLGYEQELRHFFEVVRGRGGADTGAGDGVPELLRSTLAAIRIAQALDTGAPQEIVP